MASRTVVKSRLPVAVHLEGGNYFDDMRIDIAASHQLLDGFPRNPGSKPHSSLRGALRRRIDESLQHFDIQSFLVTSGLRSGWFRDVHSYWSDILQGRRLEVADFMMLLLSETTAVRRGALMGIS